MVQKDSLIQILNKESELLSKEYKKWKNFARLQREKASKNPTRKGSCQRSEISPSSFIPRHEIFIQSDLPGKGTHTTRLCLLTPNTFKIQQGFFLTKSKDDKSACLSVKPISDQRTLTPLKTKREETNPSNLYYIHRPPNVRTELF